MCCRPPEKRLATKKIGPPMIPSGKVDLPVREDWLNTEVSSSVMSQRSWVQRVTLSPEI